MSALSNLLHPGRPYREAQNTYNQYYNQGQGYLQPYQEHGNEAYGHLSNAMQRLLNPADLYNEWASGYETSPYAKQAQEMAQTQGLNAASSMGLLGSTPALQAIQQGTTNIGLQERGNYLDNLFKQYLSGAELAQGLYATGAGAASQMGSNALNAGGSNAELTYGSKSAGANMLANILGTVSGFGMLKSLLNGSQSGGGTGRDPAQVAKLASLLAGI